MAEYFVLDPGAYLNININKCQREYFILSYLNRHLTKKKILALFCYAKRQMYLHKKIIYCSR